MRKAPSFSEKPPTKNGGFSFYETDKSENMSEQFGVSDQRHTNWFWVDNAVVKNLCKDIGPTGFTVYCVLAMYSNKSRKSWPSYTTISEQVSISRRSVITAMQKLIECGLITRIESSTKGNMYQLNDANQLVQNLHQTLPASEKNDTASEKNDTQLVKKTTRLTDTNKTHRTILNNKRDNSEDSESSKRIDHRGKPSPIAEKMRKAREKGLRPWEALARVT